MKYTGPSLLSKFPIKIKTFGDSMYPLLHDGDIVFIKKINFNTLKVNDIVCVKKNSSVFTHRIIYRSKNYLITRGDGNVQSDGKIYTKNLIGKVYKIKRGTHELNPEDIYLLQSSIYYKEIIKIKKALENAKVYFIFLKGLPIHLYFDGSHPRRFYADCDVLISRRDFKKTLNILKKNGYFEHDTSLWKLNIKKDKKKAEVSFTKKINQFYVVFDIHFEVIHLIDQIGKMNSFYDNSLINSITNKFINRHSKIDINGEIFNFLQVDDLFIFLLFHLFRHNYKGTYRFELINKVLQKNSVNFANAAKTIKLYKLENFVYATVLMLQKHYQVKFPIHFINEIKPRANYLKYIKTDILTEDIFSDELRIDSGSKKFKNIFFLSPKNHLKKSIIFLNREVLYSIYLVLTQRFLKSITR